MSKRVCSQPGCATLIDASGYCPEHARERDKARGTRQQRGYGRNYQAERRRWAPRVAAGTVTCWRCGQRITSTEPWDLGHDDNDRTVIRGPEHANHCNRAAAGRSAHR